MNDRNYPSIVFGESQGQSILFVLCCNKLIATDAEICNKMSHLHERIYYKLEFVVHLHKS